MKCTDTLEQSGIVFASLEFFASSEKKESYIFLDNADIGLIHTDMFGMIIL